MVFGSKVHKSCISHQTLVSQGLQITHEARNLGIIFDLDLTFKNNKSFFFSFSSAQTVTHDFVSGHLDQYNSSLATGSHREINQSSLN